LLKAPPGKTRLQYLLDWKIPQRVAWCVFELRVSALASIMEIVGQSVTTSASVDGSSRLEGSD
jgi:hypothetical protein